MTWLEIKTAALQKMFAISGDTITLDDATHDYIKSMPAAANEGLQRLVTAGKYLCKSVAIEQDGSAAGVVVKHDLKALAPDFYSLTGRDIYYEGEENGKTVYRKELGYQIEGEHLLVLPAKAVGKWTVYYNAYPEKITANTLDGEELPLDPELAVLLPLYIVSQLYKDDDISIATVYRNEFEKGLEAVASGLLEVAGHERFCSVKGWI